MTRLPPLLTPTDLPSVELQAMRLDGLVYAVGDCGASIDQPDNAALRASSLAEATAGQLIVELLSAAWVWGALDEPPPLPTLCVDSSSRGRTGIESTAHLREVVISPTDYAELAGVRVTTPLRTIVDLARFADTWDEALSRTVFRLLSTAGIELDEAIGALRPRRKLPHKLLAIERLESVSPS